MKIKIFMIDSISPFFVRSGFDVINWSKIPYSLLEKNGKFRKKFRTKIQKNYFDYINKICKLGYNAISIDDLAHLIKFDFYPKKIREKIGFYQRFFAKLFRVSKKNGLKIFVTSDIMFYNRYIMKAVNKNIIRTARLLKTGINYAFEKFPEIDGIILRSGESDGIDVAHDFKSRIIIKTPRHANYFLKELLPVFEEKRKLLIFRTWTTGGYKIGDLMWNKVTYDKVFSHIKSNSLIVSMKYGESDFFRYLGVNELLFYKDHKKIVEFQTRREYEGFGEYPSFIGWFYKNIYNKLRKAANVVGISVWCQTGGWSRSMNLTYLKNTSFWNEVNTDITIKIFKEKKSVERSLEEMFPGKDPDKLQKFFKLSESAILNLLYDPEFAGQKLYFNKLRIPPILHIFWDNVSVTNAIISIYEAFARNKSISVLKGFDALAKLRKMKKLNEELKLPYDHKFHYESFKIIALLRKLIYKKTGRTKALKEVKVLAAKYHKAYPLGYNFYISVKRFKTGLLMQSFIKLVIRKQKKYRLIDRILFNPVFSRILLLIYRIMRKIFPQFIGNRAMPFSTFLK